jgi:SAM-dependent methyltransferase
MACRELSVARVLAFVQASVAPQARLLEVGCGDGELAQALAAAGHEVTGVDPRLPEAPPKHARLSLLREDFLSAKLDGAFDAVLFTSSLHHIHPLSDALARAHALLVPHGRLVLDEFDLDGPDTGTVAWLESMAAHLEKTGLFHRDAHRHGGHTLAPGATPLERWQQRHQHEGQPALHAADAILAAVRERFTGVFVTRGAYLYRYLLDGLEASARGHTAARGVLAVEQDGIATGWLKAVGVRVVAES